MAALIAVAAVAVLLLILLSSAIRVAREYERGVIFRLGRLKSPPKGPGLFLLIPVIDKMVRVDLRTVTLNVPPQEVITKDNVPVRVNAVAYFRIIDPEKAIVQVENFMVATSQIAQTTLRSVLGQHVLDELLSERDKINSILQQIIDEATSPWGVKVSIVEVKDVEIPTGMQRAMARQAEAERERRAKVIAAEGEFQASEQLKNAALVLAENPMSLQLRFLQTMLEISSERSSTIILPLPIGPSPTSAATRSPDGSSSSRRVAPGVQVRGATCLKSRARASSRSAPSTRVARTGLRRRFSPSPHRAGLRTLPAGRCASSRTSTPRSSARR
jgi:regulator of protease activity HflC (stomatin/prohibitin superfamily)